MNLYDFKAKTIRGIEKDLGDYHGKVVLIVNTASKCGFTPQYKGLEVIHQTYKDRGLVVLGFHCDQFGHQEPGTEEEIENFCQINFGVTFQLFSKINVNGRATHPLYAYLRSKKFGIGNSGTIKWNFTKFLVDRNGDVVNRFSPATEPGRLTEQIEQLLNEPAHR